MTEQQPYLGTGRPSTELCDLAAIELSALIRSSRRPLGEAPAARLDRVATGGE